MKKSLDQCTRTHHYHAGDGSFISTAHLHPNRCSNTRQSANAITMIVRIPSFLALILTTVVLQQHSTTMFPACEAWAGPATRKFASGTTSTTPLEPFFLSVATRQPKITAKLDGKLQDQRSIRMLLDHPRFPSTLLTTTTASTNQFTSRPGVDTPLAPKQKYGILGFDVFTCQVGRSNVNLETWNNHGNSGDIGYRAMNARLAWNATSTSVMQKQQQHILNSAEILALKVTELKEACAERGLVKVCI